MATTTDDLYSIQRNAHSDRWTDLRERYGEKLYRRFVAKGLRRHEAEDLVQDVFVRLIDRVLKFDRERGRGSSFIYMIAHNLLVEFFRKLDRQTPDEDALRYLLEQAIVEVVCEVEVKEVQALILERAKARVSTADWRTCELYLECGMEAAMKRTGRSQRAVYQARYRVKKAVEEERQRWEGLYDL